MSNYLTYFSLPNVAVLSFPDWGYVYYIELANSGINCPHCNSYTTEINQRPVLVKDLPAEGNPIYLSAPSSVLLCSMSTIFNRTFEWVNADTYRRYESNIYERVKGSSLEKVSREENLSFDEIEGIFNHVSKQHLKKKNWWPAKRLSLDEIYEKRAQKILRRLWVIGQTYRSY